MKTLMIIDTTHGGIFFYLTYLAAFLVAAGMMINEGFRKGYPRSAWLLILLTGVIFFIIGDKVFTYSPEQWAQVFTRFHFPETDKKTVLGGIIALFTGMFLAKTWLRFNRPVLDTLAVALPLGMAISRIGCLMAGCCFGTPTNLPWGIQYDAASWAYHVHLANGLIHLHEGTSLAVHPAHLYQVIGCLLIAFVVWKTRKQWKSNGNLFLFSVLCYAVLRFFVEFVRAPESDFFAGQFFWGLKVIQWLIMGAFIAGLFILIIREKKGKASSLVCKLIGPTEFRQVFLTSILCMIVLFGRKWFSFLEYSTILLFLIPVILVLSVKLYQRHSVAGFRWVIPVILLCSISFMAQMSNPDDKESKNITFTEIGITGLVGKYSQEFQKVKVTYGCGGNSYAYNTLAQQSVPIYQTGIDASYNIWKGNYTKYKFGGRLFYGEEYPDITATNPGTGTTFGISPYASLNWHWFGFTTGFTVGQMKVPLKKKESTLKDGEIISVGHAGALIIPSLALRIGSEDIFYVEGAFPGQFPFASPYLQYRGGIGTGFGKTNGTIAAIGFSNDAYYFHMVYPIKNKIILESFYIENFLTGNQAKRIFTLGISYRFFSEKSSSRGDKK
jgi:phosphatidylglycerol:prolipoprotein diacylglycerol transferase